MSHILAAAISRQTSHQLILRANLNKGKCKAITSKSHERACSRGQVGKKPSGSTGKNSKLLLALETYTRAQIVECVRV